MTDDAYRTEKQQALAVALASRALDVRAMQDALDDKAMRRMRAYREQQYQQQQQQRQRQQTKSPDES